MSFATVNPTILSMLHSTPASLASSTFARLLLQKAESLKKFPAHTPWHTSEIPINVITSSFMGKLKASLFASHSELSLFPQATHLLRDRISLYTFAPPSHRHKHKINYKKIGEHQAKINNDWQIDEVDRHRTKANANVDYAYLGNDSPDAVGKTIVNLLVFFRLLFNTPNETPNEGVSDLMGLLSLVAIAINNITTNNPRRSQLKQIANGVNIILQNTTNLMATAVEIAFDPEIRHNLRLGLPIMDTHPAFNEYFNLSQVVLSMCNDLSSCNPTFQSLNCPFLQLPAPPAKKEDDKGQGQGHGNKKANKRRNKDERVVADNQNVGDKKKFKRSNPVNWVEVKNDDSKWKLSGHQCVVVENSTARSDIVCWSHIANNRTCTFESCLHRHPSKPSEIGTVAEAKKLIDWVTNDPTIQWVGNAKKEIQSYISST